MSPITGVYASTIRAIRILQEIEQDRGCQIILRSCSNVLTWGLIISSYPGHDGQDVLTALWLLAANHTTPGTSARRLGTLIHDVVMIEVEAQLRQLQIMLASC